MTQERLPKGIELSEIDPAYRADPHARLDRLRAECPVYRDPDLGHVILTRYEDARGLVNDRSMLRHPRNARPEAVISRAMTERAAARIAAGEKPGAESILFMDDPDHQRVRMPLQKAFYKRVAVVQPEIEAVVNAALDRLAGRESFDVLADYAVPVPVEAIAHILGVEKHRLDDFRDWSEGLILSLNPFRKPEETARLDKAGDAVSAYFGELMEKRARAPQDDLVSDVMALLAEGAPVTRDEMAVNLVSLLVGGNLTTTDLIGNGIWLFLTHPRERAKVMADPSLWPMAVEEILRIHAPVMGTARVLPDARLVGGCPLESRDSVTAMLAAANRDPAVFENPHDFDITRKHVSHVSFGGGAHICIGAPLARMEARIALKSMLERFPAMRMTEEAVEWRALPFFHGLERLNVAV